MNKPMKMKRKEKKQKHRLVYTKYARDLNINTACIYKLGKRFLYYNDITKVYSKHLGTREKKLSRRLNKMMNADIFILFHVSKVYMYIQVY